MLGIWYTYHLHSMDYEETFVPVTKTTIILTLITVTTLFSLTQMYCDNKNVIQIAHNSIFYKMTKHIETNYHLTHHHLQHTTLTLPFPSLN